MEKSTIGLWEVTLFQTDLGKSQWDLSDRTRRDSTNQSFGKEYVWLNQRLELLCYKALWTSFLFLPKALIEFLAQEKEQVEEKRRSNM